jgi:hypothetical protein
VTHPFHPLSGRQLVCVGKRYNRYGTRLLLRVNEKTVCSVPPQWTDDVGPEPDVVIGKGRAVAGVVELFQLAEFVQRLVEEQRGVRARKGKDAAIVRSTTPRDGRTGRSCASNSARKNDANDLPKLDNPSIGGVVNLTKGTSEVTCRNETLARTRRQRRSSTTAR